MALRDHLSEHNITMYLDYLSGFTFTCAGSTPPPVIGCRDCQPDLALSHFLARAIGALDARPASESPPELRGPKELLQAVAEQLGDVLPIGPR